MEANCLDDGAKVFEGIEFGPFSGTDALAEIARARSACESLARTLADAKPEELTRDLLDAMSESLMMSASALDAAMQAVSQDWGNMPFSVGMEKSRAMGMTLDEMADVYMSRHRG